MKHILIICILITVIGCGILGPDYNYIWDVKVTYQDNTIDTTHIEHESFNGNQVGIYISTSRGGIFSKASIPSCLTTHCGMRQRTICCGVRKFEILNHEKVRI